MSKHLNRRREDSPTLATHNLKAQTDADCPRCLPGRHRANTAIDALSAAEAARFNPESVDWSQPSEQKERS